MKTQSCSSVFNRTQCNLLSPQIWSIPVTVETRTERNMFQCVERAPEACRAIVLVYHETYCFMAFACLPLSSSLHAFLVKWCRTVDDNKSPKLSSTIINYLDLNQGVLSSSLGERGESKCVAKPQTRATSIS